MRDSIQILNLIRNYILEHTHKDDWGVDICYGIEEYVNKLMLEEINTLNKGE